jgi:hypothetical protein
MVALAVAPASQMSRIDARQRAARAPRHDVIGGCGDCRLHTEPTSRFVIAVFDEWQNLHAAIEDLSLHGIAPRGAVLFAHSDRPGAAELPSEGLISCFLAETTELPFLSARQRVRCTAGALAHDLSARAERGARRLAAALAGWVSREHANALESHIDKGRLVLWFELAQPQDLDVVCGRLVQTSPHVVGMCGAASQA